MIRLLISSGHGPAECRIAVAGVLAAMAREADPLELDLDIARGVEPDRHVPASAIVAITGDGAAAFARSWTGSVLWVAQSPLRPHHKRKNWFVGVFELPPAPRLPSPIVLTDVRFTAFRAGGPGGQHQNKTESAVRAVHAPTGLTVVVREGRSQHRNKAMALERLSALMAAHADLARVGERGLVHAEHDQLERGRQVRRFVGTGWKEG